MAKLDLIPDLQTLIIQGSLFGVAAMIVKTKYVTPYLKLKDKKDSLTTGDASKALEIKKQCVDIEQTISKKMISAVRDATKAKDEQKALALDEQRSIVKEAETNAKQELKKMTHKLESLYQEEREKFPSAIEMVAQQFYKKVTG